MKFHGRSPGRRECRRKLTEGTRGEKLMEADGRSSGGTEIRRKLIEDLSNKNEVDRRSPAAFRVDRRPSGLKER